MKYTRFGGVEAEAFKGPVEGSVEGPVKGYLDATAITAADSVTLAESDRAAFIAAAFTAASKVLTLALPAKAACFVANTGTNAFTLKNVSGDTGTSLATGKVAAVFVASTAANGALVYVLN